MIIFRLNISRFPCRVLHFKKSLYQLSFSRHVNDDVFNCPLMQHIQNSDSIINYVVACSLSCKLDVSVYEVRMIEWMDGWMNE